MHVFLQLIFTVFTFLFYFALSCWQTLFNAAIFYGFAILWCGWQLVFCPDIQLTNLILLILICICEYCVKVNIGCLCGCELNKLKRKMANKIKQKSWKKVGNTDSQCMEMQATLWMQSVECRMCKYVHKCNCNCRVHTVQAATISKKLTASIFFMPTSFGKI